MRVLSWTEVAERRSARRRRRLRSIADERLTYQQIQQRIINQVVWERQGRRGYPEIEFRTMSNWEAQVAALGRDLDHAEADEEERKRPSRVTAQDEPVRQDRRGGWQRRRAS